jgi:hypothetical protein
MAAEFGHLLMASKQTFLIFINASALAHWHVANIMSLRETEPKLAFWGVPEARAIVALGCRRLSHSEVEGLSAEDAKRTIEQLMSTLETFERLNRTLRAFSITFGCTRH